MNNIETFKIDALVYLSNKEDKQMINEVLTFAEAAELWGLSMGTLRMRLSKGYMGDLIEGVDYRKSGKVWLITKDAMVKLYGPIKKDQEN